MSGNTNKMQLAVNAALDSAISRARMRAAMPGVSMDTKRPQSWCEFGWPATITAADLYNLYSRGGLAFGAVTKIVGACWKTPPQLIDGDPEDKSRQETPWERKAKRAFTPVMWRKFADADRRRLAGRFSGIILQIADSQEWDQPVNKSQAVIKKLIPAWSSSLKPVEIVTDRKSPNFGQPAFWQYTETSPEGGQIGSVKIHPDRIFILGDWSADALGFLEPAYNAFVNIEKVEGGSGESFLKNAARQLNINFDKEVNLESIAATYGVKLADLQEKFNEAAREINRGNDQLLITQGASVAPLVSAVSDPSPTYDINLQTVSAALDIPSKILVGMQTGERASSEDQKYFNARCQSRREDLGFEVHEFVEQLQRIGVLEPKEPVSVVWDDLSEQTKTEKLTSAKLMSDINAVAISTGEAVFTAKEIRTEAGFEPEPADGDALPDVKPPANEDPSDGNRTPPADPAQQQQ